MEPAPEWIHRYSRQILLKEIGGGGQVRLGEKRVGIVGAGAMGAPLALYLAAAGIGTLEIIDPDPVAPTDPARAPLHSRAGIGQPRPLSAAATLAALNPAVRVIPGTAPLEREPERLDRRIRAWDLALLTKMGTPLRERLLAACNRCGIPLFAAWMATGQGFMTNLSGTAPHPEPDRGTDTEPETVPGMAGVLGSILAGEAIKLLLGLPHARTGERLRFDPHRGDFETLETARRG